jgi:hypothetical protein
MRRQKGNADSLRPIGIFGDEAGHWISEFDSSYAQRCRSARGYLAYTTQSINSLIHAFGGGDSGTKAFEDLAANLQIRVGHANLCPATNKFHADSLSMHKAERVSISLSEGDPDSRNRQRRKNRTVNTSVSDEYVLPPIAFTGLETGGEYSSPPLTAEGIFIIGGRRFKHNNKRYLKVRVRQEDPVPRSEMWHLAEPHAVHWVKSVTTLDVVRAFLKSRKQGRQKFNEWINFWTDGWIELGTIGKGGTGDAE